MSNPTSNFGWQMPTPTDLVTDLPADFEVFGQAVDTSMADLKGGTTGQILSKATNTDMDFVWITNDQGDITAVNVTSPITGGGTAGAVTVGIQSASTSQSGAVQLSDSTSTTSSVLAATSTAVKSAYDLANTANTTASAASTLKYPINPVLNSNFSVWQRGTSISVGTGARAYTADRWELNAAGSGNASTVSQQSTGDTTNLPNIQYCARVQRNSGQTGTSGHYFAQSFETINSIPYAGKSVTVSFYARKGANFSPTNSELGIGLYSGTGTDQNKNASYTGNTYVGGTGAILTTTWQRFSFTGSIGATATEIALQFSCAHTGTAGTADYFEVTGVQIDVGSSVQSYRPNGSTQQAELAACQRYFWQFITGNSQTIGLSTYNRSNQVNVAVPFPVTMRTTPTLSASSGTNYYSIDQATTDYLDSLTLNLASPSLMSLYNNTNVSGTAGTAFLISSANASASIAFSAEL